MQDDEEKFTFDKFMDEIVVRERKLEKRDVIEETPARKYAKKYRELPQNRTKIVRGGQ